MNTVLYWQAYGWSGPQ